MALKIIDPERFATVMEFALANGAARKLIERLEYLANYGEGNNTCELHNDFAPHSFEFLMCRPDGSRWFHGGLIYSGPGQPLDGTGPALTVGLFQEAGHSWSVHT